MMTTVIDEKIMADVRLCAKEGWKATFVFHNGEVFPQAFITATDFDAGAITLERVGERHLQPRLVFLNELAELRPDWS